MTKPRLGIVMATCNGEPFLREQIESIFGQELLPDELLILDDASVDGTRAVIEGCTAEAPFKIRTQFNSVRLGYRENFKRGVLESDCDWILFCDQDDRWLPNKLVTLATAITSGSGLVYLHNLEFGDDRLTPLPGSLETRLKAEGLDHAHFVKGCCMAVERNFAVHCMERKPDHRSHDDWINAVGSALERRIFLNQILIQHRVHKGQISGALTRQTVGKSQSSLGVALTRYGRWIKSSSQFPAKAINHLRRGRLLTLNQRLAAVECALQSSALVSSPEVAERLFDERDRLQHRLELMRQSPCTCARKAISWTTDESFRQRFEAFLDVAACVAGARECRSA